MMIPQLIALYLVSSLVVAILGSNRRFGFWGYLFASFLLTPIIGMLLYLATDGPMRKKTDQRGEKETAQK